MPAQRPLKEIFADAIELPEHDRAVLLDRECGGDPALRGRLEELLRAYRGGSGFLDSPTASPPEAITVEAPPQDGPGTRIGPYRILQQIGEGGFGVVFMAEQDQPIRRRVALKIIKLGMDTKQVIARFEAERQALAMMDHPNIAKVFDAGATPAGRPFFVMELVTGEPVTTYCDAHALKPGERLELFATVCQAVQHAHTKGIIHRDLKPSNVMVAEVDGCAVPKVIDFGIAKATGARLTEKTLFTEHRALIGTPEYMSPEQASSSPDLDTRTDVYSLGVLLYELLTGATPFDGRRLRSAAWDEMLRIIREEDPQKPSTRVSTLESLPSVAARRRCEPARLARLIRGDLDWIVMKCLEKNRSRRYETASGLALDIGRFLAHEPIEASPPSRMYRMRKFVRRHRTGTAAAALVSLAVLLGLASTTWGILWALRERHQANEARKDESRQRVEAQESAARANSVLTLLTEMLQPPQTRDESGEPLPFVDHLIQFGAALDARVVGQPEVEADVRAELGRALLAVESYAAAEEQFRRVLEIRQDLADADMMPVTSAVYDLANTVLTAGGAARALSIAEGALERARSSHVGDNLGIAELHHLVADMQIANGKFDVAEASSKAALAMRERLGGRLQERVAADLSQLGNLEMARGRWDQAEKYHREAAALFREMYGEFYPSIGIVDLQIAFVLHARGDFAGAAAFSRDSVAHARRALSPESPPQHRLMLANRLVNLANREAWTPHGIAAAEMAAREASTILRGLEPDIRYPVLEAEWQVGVFCWLSGRPAECREVMSRALARARTGDSSESKFWQYSAAALLSLAIADAGGDLAEAEAHGWTALEGVKSRYGPSHWRVALLESELALILRLRGNEAAALPLEQHARSVGLKAASRGQWSAGRCRRVGEKLMALGEPTIAEPLLVQSEQLQRELCPGLWIHLDAIGALGECFLAQSKFAEAEPLLLRAHQGMSGPSVGQWPDDRLEARDPVRDAVERVVRLYQAWDAAEPGKGYDAKAAEWRARIEEFDAGGGG